MKVEIYSDIACPWCYIGERRFEKAVAQFAGRDDVDVVFRPFQLDPGAPEAGMPISQYLERRFGGSIADKLQHVTDTAAGEGIAIDWDSAIAANTRTAHRLLGFAEREYGVEMQHRLVDALFAAHFSQGVNVADVDALADVAGAVGIDRAKAHAYLTSDQGVPELTAALGEAAELGVSSVPTFVFEGLYAVSGAQPTATFVQVLEEVDKRSRVPAE
ncbi:MAG TPA: DsbA family oxidoreductase [Gemmatimonadaceae bacterium]|jgi:predicted DsbA family dithiol-disulfide isomerase